MPIKGLLPQNTLLCHCLKWHFLSPFAMQVLSAGEDSTFMTLPAANVVIHTPVPEHNVRFVLRGD